MLISLGNHVWILKKKKNNKKNNTPKTQTENASNLRWLLQKRNRCGCDPTAGLAPLPRPILEIQLNPVKWKKQDHPCPAGWCSRTKLRPEANREPAPQASEPAEQPHTRLRARLPREGAERVPEHEKGMKGIRWTDLCNRTYICQDKNTWRASGAGTLTVWASCLSSDFANHLSLNSIQA